jgi:DNA-nicking Smr family endonuclease
MIAKIDLHGVKHENVASMLDSFIWEEMKKKSAAIHIITGNSSEMKRIVTEIANEYGFEIADSFGNEAQMTLHLI